MREIKFRAKDAFNGCWKYGYFYINEGLTYILNCDGASKVISGTEGQYTGLKDKNGKEIYEGDIVTYPNPLCNGEVKFGSYEFGNYDTHQKGNGFYIDAVERSSCGEFNGKDIKVIGNIHENPELLKG